MSRSVDSLRRLNIGCGPHHALEDWWNVDIRAFDGVDEVMDVTEPWKVQGLEFIYAEHFLEHLTPRQAIKFFGEALKALEVGGAIRLSTPSLEWVLRTHFTFESDPAKDRIQTFATNRAFHGWGHEFLYSRSTLEWLITGIGFSEVRFFDYGESDTSEFVGIESHGGLSRSGDYPSVWVVEAKRPEEISGGVKDVEAEFVENFVKYVEGGH